MSSTTFFFIFIPILAILLLAINLIFAPHNPYPEKNSPFECGFHSFLYQNRTQFSISFFIFGLLFLLFDIEIVLIYPFALSAYSNGLYGLFVLIVFFLVLTLGFAFEINKKALRFEKSRQIVYPLSCKDIDAIKILLDCRQSTKVYGKPRLSPTKVKEMKSKLKLVLKHIDILNRKLISLDFKLQGNRVLFGRSAIDIKYLFTDKFAENFSVWLSYYDTFSIHYDTPNEVLNLPHNMYRISKSSRKHNTSVIPSNNLALKNLLISLVHDITPGFTGNCFHTPLHTLRGTEEPGGLLFSLEYTKVEDLYNSWLASSVLLRLELDILQNALSYVLKKMSGAPVTFKEYRAYINWLQRQLEIEEHKIHQGIANPGFRLDFTSMEVMLREICEDLLYVQLNLLLANEIINYLSVYSRLEEHNRAMFIYNISLLIDNHINKYNNAYNSLQKVREYFYDKYSTKDLIYLGYGYKVALKQKIVDISTTIKILEKEINK